MSDITCSTNEGVCRTKPLSFSISFCDGNDDGTTPLINDSRDNIEDDNEVNYYNQHIHKHDLCRATSLPTGSSKIGNTSRYVNVKMNLGRYI